MRLPPVRHAIERKHCDGIKATAASLQPRGQSRPLQRQYTAFMEL
jgi:hypothetical protein